MEENKKVNLEKVEAKENDCKLNDKDLESVAGGVGYDICMAQEVPGVGEVTWKSPNVPSDPIEATYPVE